MGMTGIFANEPGRAIGAAARLTHRLNLLADEAVTLPISQSTK